MKNDLLNAWIAINLELKNSIEALNTLKQEREEILKEAKKEITPELIEKMKNNQQNLLRVERQSQMLKEKSEELKKHFKNLK